MHAQFAIFAARLGEVLEKHQVFLKMDIFFRQVF